MKAMIIFKRSWPNTDQAFSFLSSKIKDTNEGYWKKLLRVMRLLKVTINNVLTLEDDNTNNLTWYIHVPLAVHAGM